jgi:ribosomal 30S subunit maturation factor RimM
VHFIPFLSSLVVEVDPEKAIMVIDPPPGLLEL